MKKHLQFYTFLLLTLFSFNVDVSAQDEYIFGIVTDKDDKPLENVKVENRYIGNFTFTDIEGRYRLYLKPKRMQVVEYSIEGMETQVEEFYLREGDKREINVVFWDLKDIIICTFPFRKRNLIKLSTIETFNKLETIPLEKIKAFIDRQ